MASFVVVAGILAAVWVQMAPVRLFDFDSANFALALDTFNPALHLPQPPGYPLYVGLTRLIYFVVGDAVLSFLIAGILAAAAAVVMLERLGTLMFGRTAGICAALLLMTNPILWQAGMIDQVRVFLAVISAGVALLVWPLWDDRRNHRHFVWACFLLGFLAGFRPETLVSLTPLLLIAAIRARLPLRQYVFGALALGAGAAPWFAVLIATLDGFSGFATVMQRYAHEQAGGSSILLGAQLSGVWKMCRGAMWWLSLSVVAWLPALVLLPFTRLWKGRNLQTPREVSGQVSFLLAWFVPQFLFGIIVHIAAAGHALGFAVPLCLMGGWTISRLAGIGKGAAVYACVALALSLNIYFFLKPYRPETAEASYRVIRYVSRNIAGVLDRIDTISTSSRVSIIDYDSLVAWRILEYYYPATPILHLPGIRANAAEPAWLFLQKGLAHTYRPAQEIELDTCGTLLWLVSDDRARKELMSIPGAENGFYFVLTPSVPGTRFRVGRYNLRTSNEPCKAAPNPK